MQIRDRRGIPYPVAGSLEAQQQLAAAEARVRQINLEADLKAQQIKLQVCFLEEEENYCYTNL